MHKFYCIEYISKLLFPNTSFEWMEKCYLAGTGKQQLWNYFHGSYLDK